MQTAIHPKQNTVNVVCTCGNKFTVSTTKSMDVMHIEVCFKCHSAYTGKRKIASAGAIEKFQKKFDAYTKAISKNPTGEQK